MVAAAQALLLKGISEGAHTHSQLLMKQVWPDEYRSSPIITRLLSDIIMRNAEDLVGCSLADHGRTQAQIAVRLKRADGKKDFGVQMRWHIDGFDQLTTARFGSIIQVNLKCIAHKQKSHAYKRLPSAIGYAKTWVI